MKSNNRKYSKDEIQNLENQNDTNIKVNQNQRNNELNNKNDKVIMIPNEQPRKKNQKSKSFIKDLVQKDKNDFKKRNHNSNKLDLHENFEDQIHYQELN